MIIIGEMEVMDEKGPKTDPAAICPSAVLLLKETII